MKKLKCTRCKKHKLLKYFTPNKKKKDRGYNHWCKACFSEAALKTYYKYHNKYKEKERLRAQKEKTKRKKYAIVYNKKNKDKIRERTRKYFANRLKTDSLFKLKLNIINLIRVSFKSRRYNKTSRTATILGLSIPEFKLYIESLWEPWMNWQNHGKYNGKPNHGWDIDHIIPVSSAKSKKELLKLNHYTNLQPLCSYINRYVKSHHLLLAK